MSEIAKTHQESVDAGIASKNQGLLAAAAPKSAAKIVSLKAKAEEAHQLAEEEFHSQVSAMRRIQALINSQSRLFAEIEHLQALAGIAKAHESNGLQALEYYVGSRVQVDGYAAQNYNILVDEMLRAKILEPLIPNAIASRQRALQDSKLEIQRLSGAHQIDVPALLAELKK